MSRHDTGFTDSTLREVLNIQNAEKLKQLLALIPGVQMKALRKGEVIEALSSRLLGPDLREIWDRLKPLEQSAVAETLYADDGGFHKGPFHANYGALPVFATEGRDQWDKLPAPICLFMHSVGYGNLLVPEDLREKLKAFVPKPPGAQLASLEEVPASPPRIRSSRRFDTQADEVIRESHEVPLTQRLTEPAAIQDLRTTLRLIDQEKLAVSATTLLPSRAAMELLCGLLREQDFFELSEKQNKWDPEIGPIKGFSWPLLVQAARLATVRNGKLVLTKQGRSALESPPAQTLRDIWDAWRDNKIIDEFSRVDTIKGQKGRGGRNMTPPVERRLAIRCALSNCPVGRWIEVGEFSRYMQAAGFGFAVSRDPASLYICEPHYGNLGYAGYGGWNILQERYLLCLLFEYAATLGIIDVAYEHPAGARDDYCGQWGTDDLIFLSRYDGLRYFRLTPLGAFILGETKTYEPPRVKPNVSLTVLPKRQIRIDEGALSPDEVLLLEGFADRETDRLWSLDEARALQSVEKGARMAELRAFLGAGDPQPLPESVEAFLLSIEQRGTACVSKGTCLLIECLSPQIADIIARDARAGALCRRVGDQGLVIPVDKEKPFRDALNALGYGMPRV